MLNASASASSSRDRNRLLGLCLALDVWLFRGAGDRDAPVLPLPERRAEESLEKNCWVEDSAGLIWLEDESCGALLEDVNALLGMLAGLDMASFHSRRVEGGWCCWRSGSSVQRWSCLAKGRIGAVYKCVLTVMWSLSDNPEGGLRGAEGSRG